MTARVMLVIAALVAAAGVAATTVLLVRTRSAASLDRVEAQIGAVRLAYAPAYARFGPGRAGGQLDRLELAFTFPDLRAAGEAASALPADGAASSQAPLVFLTARPEDETADPADRTATLYGRFLQPDVLPGDNGLLTRQFEPNSPFDREQLYFVPPEGRVFAARCLRPTQPPSDLPSTCLTTIRTAGLDLDVRFPPALLPRWDALLDGVRTLVASFLVK